MLRIHDRSNRTTYPWPKDKIPDYDNFNYSKKENFDFDEYVYVSRPVNNCILTAEITKNKGEKVTDEDRNVAFATSLVVAMTGLDFNQETAQNYLTALPPEFYTKEAYDLVCKKMTNYEKVAPPFEKDRLDKNLRLFQEFSHKVNKEEIPAPTDKSKNLGN